jgi:outer membrane protein TolC
VTRVYWKAVTAREIAVEAEQALELAAAMLERIDAEIAEQTVSEVDGLKRRTTLLEQQNELLRYKQTFVAAKAELASLIGLAPGAPLTLAETDLERPIEPVTFDLETLEWEALRSRPELYEKDRQHAISRDEVHVALVQMFPHVSAFWRFDTDLNRFLVYKQWETAGFRASWDLLSIPQRIVQRESIKLQTELVAKRRMAMAIAILTQLHLSLLDYDEAVEQYGMARSIAEAHRRLLDAVQSAADEGASHTGTSLDQRMKYLKARGRYLATCANLQASHARVLNTVGRDVASPEDRITATSPAPRDSTGWLLQQVDHWVPVGAVGPCSLNGAE